MNNKIFNNHFFVIIYIFFLVTVLLCYGCNSNQYPKEVTRNEASKVLKVDIPIPLYLPKGYNISIYELIDATTLREIITKQNESNIYINILWKSDGILPPVRLQTRQIDINENTGYLTELDTINSLVWQWKPNLDNPGVFKITVTANNTFPLNELFKIARSITQ